MPACESVKLREHADRVERDQPVDLRVGDDEHDDRRDREEDDAVREHEPVPALGELARHEVVLGVEAREPREVGEARVRGEHEDEHRAGLQPVEEHVADGAAAVHEPADLADDGRRAALVRASRARAPRGPTGRGTSRRACVPMITSVMRAFFHDGSLNAGTPLEIASTPVTAAPPDANACSTT